MICSNRGTGILPVSFSASNRQERLFLFRHQTGRMPVPQISIQFGTATSLVLTVEQAGKTVSFSASNRQDGCSTNIYPIWDCDQSCTNRGTGRKTCFFFGIKQAGWLFLFRHQTGRMPVPQISIKFGTHKYLSNLM
jgi:hypothetical protein